MKLSIIIPVYNVEKYLSKSLDSLLDQDLQSNEYEIIIVNDGATDSSPLIAQKYVDENSNIYLYNQKNKGVGAARNKGVKLAKGKYIYFIDPDDYLSSNVLKTLVISAERINAQVLGFMSKSTVFYDLKKSETNLKKQIEIKVYDGISYIGKNKFKNEIWWYLIDRKFLLNTGIYFIEGRWMEDAIFTASLLLKTKRMAYLPWDCHRHVKTPNSAMTNTETVHYNKVIYDNANAAIIYGNLINNLESHENKKECIKRLKTRQESFVFFLTVRAIKSNLCFNQLWEILLEMKSNGVYPIKNFISEDYNGFVYRMATSVLNNKLILLIVFSGYRAIRSFWRKVAA